MNTKTADTKGRVALGQEFAGRTFIVKEVPDTGDIILTPGAVIPEREMWLYQNAEALASVKRGLQELAEGQLSDNPPDLDADKAFADSIPDDLESDEGE